MFGEPMYTYRTEKTNVYRVGDMVLNLNNIVYLYYDDEKGLIKIRTFCEEFTLKMARDNYDLLMEQIFGEK